MFYIGSIENIILMTTSEKLRCDEPPTGFLDFYLTHSQLLNSSKNPILGHFCPVFVPVQEGLILGQTELYRDVT